jgi:hypothetical protein
MARSRLRRLGLLQMTRDIGQRPGIITRLYPRGMKGVGSTNWKAMSPGELSEVGKCRWREAGLLLSGWGECEELGRRPSARSSEHSPASGCSGGYGLPRTRKGASGKIQGIEVEEAATVRWGSCRTSCDTGPPVIDLNQVW